MVCLSLAIFGFVGPEGSATHYLILCPTVLQVTPVQTLSDLCLECNFVFKSFQVQIIKTVLFSMTYTRAPRLSLSLIMKKLNFDYFKN